MGAIRTTTTVVEVLYEWPSASAKASAQVIEVLVASIAYDPTTPTGAGVSQDVIEVLVAQSADPRAYLTDDVIEVLVTDSTQSGGNPGAGPNLTSTFGYAV